VVCQPPAEIKSTDEQAIAQARTKYIEDVRPTLYNLLALLVQYALDCICHALMPPCPQPATDDRLILACITVKDNKIVDICDFCHRRYAGSFPALYHWLSLVPIIPVIAYAIERLCCYDWLSPQYTTNKTSNQQGCGDFTNGLIALLNSLDPDGSSRKKLYAGGDFSCIITKYRQLIDEFSSPAKIVTQIVELLCSERLNLTQVTEKAVDVGQPKSDVETPKVSADSISELQATIQALQGELTALRGEVDQLKSRDKGKTGRTGTKPQNAPPQE
jgi:hypothetical protein